MSTLYSPERTLSHTAPIDGADMYILVGPTLSGKTTYAYDRVLLGASKAEEILSIDDLKGLGAGSEEPIDIYMRLIGARMRGRNIIADVGSSDQELWRHLLGFARSHGLRPVAVVFDVPLRVLLDRRMLVDDPPSESEVIRDYEEYVRQRPLIDEAFDQVISGA